MMLCYEIKILINLALEKSLNNFGAKITHLHYCGYLLRSSNPFTRRVRWSASFIDSMGTDMTVT